MQASHRAIAEPEYRSSAAALLALLAGGLLAALAAAPARAAELPPGPGSLEERRSERQRAPGVRWSRVLREAARVMPSLGARDALALDGGGSTTMTVGRRVANRRSDGRQRRISDALVVLP